MSDEQNKSLAQKELEEYFLIISKANQNKDALTYYHVNNIADCEVKNQKVRGAYYKWCVKNSNAQLINPEKLEEYVKKNA